MKLLLLLLFEWKREREYCIEIWISTWKLPHDRKGTIKHGNSYTWMCTAPARERRGGGKLGSDLKPWPGLMLKLELRKRSGCVASEQLRYVVDLTAILRISRQPCLSWRRLMFKIITDWEQMCRARIRGGRPTRKFFLSTDKMWARYVISASH